MQALQADVLPSAEDFARDANLMNVPGDLIGALCPLFTGHILGVFHKDKAARRHAYTWFFLLSAATGESDTVITIDIAIIAAAVQLALQFVQSRLLLSHPILCLSGLVPMIFIWLLSRLPTQKQEQVHIGAEAAIQRWDDYRKQIKAADERKL